MGQMLTAKQVAEVKGCSDRYIKRIIQEGKLQAVESLNDKNRKTCKKVKSNKGACGVDGMNVDELLSFLKDNGKQLKQQLMDGKYKPNPVRRVEIPKETKGEFRKLGVPTVVDRVFQQAITQVLAVLFTELGEKRKELLAEKAAQEATFLPNLLMKYMEVRKAERSDWTRAGQNRGTAQDLNAVSEALSYLRQKGLSTVEDLEAFIESSGESAADYRSRMKPKETRSNVIDRILAARTECKECKPVYEQYRKIYFKKSKEKFKLEHPEIARFEKSSAYLAKHPDDKDSTKKELTQEQATLLEEIADLKTPLTEIQEDLKKLRDIRYWVRKATPGTEESKELPKKQPLKEVLQDKTDEQKAQRTAPVQTKQQKQDMEL